MTEFLTIPLPGIVTGFQLLVSAIVTGTWGALAIYEAVCGRKDAGKPLVGSFEFSLGQFLVFSDAVVYFALSVEFLRQPMGIPLWFWVTMSYASLWTLAAFRDWAHAKINGGWDGHH